MPVEVRGRDDRIFGGGKNEKKKEPVPTVDVQDTISQLGPDSSAAEYKAVGNALMQNGSFTLSIKYYSAAVERDPSSEVLYSNRSAAYLQSTLLSGPSLALKDADRAIAAKPEWFKGYLRKGDAFFAVEKFTEAIECYVECLARNPTCDTAKDSKALCEQYISDRQKSTASPHKQQGSAGGNSSFSTGSPPGSPQFRKPPPVDQPITKEEKKQLHETNDAESLLKSWSRDTDIGQTSKPAHKPRSVELSSVDRTEGQALKNSWLNSYKQKKTSDATLSQKSELESRQQQLSGENFDYKTKSGGGPHDLARGTDAVGRAILADAYKEHKGESKYF